MRWMVRTIKGILVGLIVCFCAVFITPTAHAGELPPGVIAVDAAASGQNNGLSWADAFKFLQDALEFARNNQELVDEIWVAAATYYPDESDAGDSDDREDYFDLVDDVAVYGGFLNGDDFEDRDPETNITILSGDIDQDDGPGQFENNDNNSYHVVKALSVGSGTIINGFTITGANANGLDQGTRGFGGGMASNDSTPIIVRCVFFVNSADSATFSGGGGGLRISSFPPGETLAFVINCSFIDNRATEEDGPGGDGGRGGGLLTGLSRLKVMNCLFDSNETLGDDGDEGGTHDSRKLTLSWPILPPRW